jgi:hypothetical protein
VEETAGLNSSVRGMKMIKSKLTQMYSKLARLR